LFIVGLIIAFHWPIILHTYLFHSQDFLHLRNSIYKSGATYKSLSWLSHHISTITLIYFIIENGKVILEYYFFTFSLTHNFILPSTTITSAPPNILQMRLKLPPYLKNWGAIAAIYLHKMTAILTTPMDVIGTTAFIRRLSRIDYNCTYNPYLLLKAGKSITTKHCSDWLSTKPARSSSQRSLSTPLNAQAPSVMLITGWSTTLSAC